MSRNFKLFSGAAVLFYLAGSMNEAPALYVMSAVCLACILGCYVISRMAAAGLALKLDVKPGIVWSGRKAEVEIELANVGIIPRPAVPVTVELTNLTVPTVQSSYLFPMPGLSAGQSVYSVGTITATLRGEYKIDAPRVLGGDPLGMFNRPGPPAGSVSFLCLPQTVAISREDVTNMLSAHARLQTASRQQRRGDTTGIRPHEPGDELRDVHWKVAAHIGELVVKQYSGGRDYSAAFWLDTQAENVIADGPKSSFECQVVAAASLIQILTELNLDIELFGEGLPTSLRTPDRGRSTYQRWLFALARAKPAGQRGFAANVGEWTALVPPGVTVFAITSGIEAAAIDALREIAARGIGLRVILCGADDAEQMVQRRQLAALESLRAAGAPAVLAVSASELSQAFSQLATMSSLREAEGVRR